MKKILVLMTVVCLACAMFIGCSKEEEKNGNDAQEKKVKITFMDGETVLGSVEAVSGKVLDKASYENYEKKEDHDFLGWYETPSFLEVSKKDLSKDSFTEDRNLYGSFKNNKVVEDTRRWYVVGETKAEEGFLKDSKWANASVEESVREKYELKKSDSAPNTFVLTAAFDEGDNFQIISDWQWEGQKGFGCVTEYDENCLVSGGGLNDDTKKTNIKVAAAGTYVITLTTDPENPALDTISIKAA